MEPDAFYRDFFTALLGTQLEVDERALADTERSAFTIYERFLPLGDGE